MKSLLKLFVILCIFGSCQSPAENQNTTSENATKVSQPIADKKQDAARKRAMNVPANKLEPREANDFKALTEEEKNNRYISETARKPIEMNSEFPFDIKLRDADGKIHASKDLLKNDGPILVCFWLTTCFPCKIEMLELSKVYADWEKETGVRMLAISTDFMKNAEKFDKMVKKEDWPWETYHDYNREFRRVMEGGLNGMPQTYLFDGDGNQVYYKKKYRPGDEKILFEKIKSIASK